MCGLARVVRTIISQKKISRSLGYGLVCLLSSPYPLVYKENIGYIFFHLLARKTFPIIGNTKGACKMSRCHTILTRDELTFIANVRNTLSLENMTQKELSMKCGMKKSNLSILLNGHVHPKILTCARIADALNVPLWKLFVPDMYGKS